MPKAVPDPDADSDAEAEIDADTGMKKDPDRLNLDMEKLFGDDAPDKDMDDAPDKGGAEDAVDTEMGPDKEMEPLITERDEDPP